MMEKLIFNTPAEMGKTAANHAAGLINGAITAKGNARILVSTGASQFDFFESLLKQDIDWQKVTMFHLDEYIGIGESHPASFVRYLKERFLSRVNMGGVCFIDGTKDPAEVIAAVNAKISEAPIDMAAIGIGENAHIAFNDPPADFDADEPFIIVTLDEGCKRQQVREGWFPTLDDVPKTAISISPKQIMKAKAILSIVPHKVKAKAVADTLNANKPDPLVPASLLKTHPDWTLYLDKESASML
jgi:glucosamine-6-phosphate deaminase